MHSIHGGHKDYNCESCGKSFSQLQSLKRHIHIVHEGQKDFKCNDCTKTFTSKQNLKLHLHSIHNNAQSLNIQLMKATKFTNVNLVVNHFLKM